MNYRQASSNPWRRLRGTTTRLQLWQRRLRCRPQPPRPPLRRQPLLDQLPRRLEHEISRIDGRIRELEDECYRLVSEGHGSTLVIRFRIEKMEALRAKLISRYLQQQQNDDGGDNNGGDAPPSPPAAGGAAAVN
uniref:Uncharacterized protein n=1 Tax=Oryza glumipatula TaxID=40148 RepID=A0A0E0ASF4_9ORYZ